MNNEINTNEENIVKKSGNTKPKGSMQNILAVFILVAIVAIILLIIFLDKSNSLGGVVLIFASVVAFIFGIIFISMIGIGKSSSEYLKNKNQLTFSEKKILKRWMIFDIFFFLVFPVCVGIYSWIIGTSSFVVSLFILVFTISLASGSKALIKNKNSSILKRISGWFLVIFSIIVLVIYLFSIFHK